MRRFFQMLLLALVLLTVALVSALTAMRFAIHGREVTIPKLVGMTPLEAERAVAVSGLEVVVERQFYSPDISEGRIMSQVPLAGVKVRRGWAIRVAQSLGPQRVAIPDVTGESERVAELNVRRRGLDLGSVAQVKRRVGAEDQPVGKSWGGAGGLCDAEFRGAAIGQCDPGATGCGDQSGEGQCYAGAASRRRTAGPCASAPSPARRSEHDRDAESGAGTKDSGGQCGEF